MPDPAAPQRHLIDTRSGLDAAVLQLLAGAQRTVRCAHRDGAAFGLAQRAVAEALQHLLLAQRGARVLILVDDVTWLDTRAPRLRTLQRQFAHALHLRQAAADDPVGDRALLLADETSVLRLAPARVISGELWMHNRLQAQPVAVEFDRRWDAAGHDLPVAPLGLG